MNSLIDLLQYLLEQLGGKTWPPNPPPPNLPQTFDPLQKALNAAISKNEVFKSLGVVILNFGPSGKLYAQPTCAQIGDVRAAIGSAGKLAIFYAAFQLKADVQFVLDAFSRNLSPSAAPKLADLQEPLANYWGSIAALRQVSIPDLTTIFDEPSRQNGRWTVSFKGIAACGYMADWASNPERKHSVDKLCTAHQHEYSFGDASDDKKPAELKKWQTAIDKLNFAERLWLTTRWSDNLAATETAIDIGRSAAPAPGAQASPITLAYIQAVLSESGLGDAEHGFWLNYAYQEPAPPLPPRLNLWDNTRKLQVSDAQSLARLLIAVVTGKLISTDGSVASEMRNLLRHLDPFGQLIESSTYTNLDDPSKSGQVNWAKSFTLQGMAFAGLTGKLALCASKLGISGHTIADWAIVECQPATVPSNYRFGVVVVNGSDSGHGDTISSFAQSFFGTALNDPKYKDALNAAS